MPRAQVEQAGFPLPGTMARSYRLTHRWQRRLLVGVLLATILTGLGMILLSQTRAAPEVIPPAVTSRLVENRSMAELGSLPGFQRRGNSVVGEVCTRDGQVLRLVLDARHQTLLGFRVLEGKAGDRQICAPQPLLPSGQTPAN